MSLLWAEFAAMLFCLLQYATWLFTERKIKHAFTNFQSLITSQHAASGKVNWWIDEAPECLRNPLQVLIRHRHHPGRWDQVEAEIEENTTLFRTLSSIVFSTATLTGLMLTLVGIMTSMAVLEHNTSDVAGVLKGFRLAFVSSIMGILIVIPTCIIYKLATNLMKRRAKNMVSLLMDFEILMAALPEETNDHQVVPENKAIPATVDVRLTTPRDHSTIIITKEPNYVIPATKNPSDTESKQEERLHPQHYRFNPPNGHGVRPIDAVLGDSGLTTQLIADTNRTGRVPRKTNGEPTTTTRKRPDC